jgi:hypothetical protein
MGVRGQQQETPETLEVFVFNDKTHQFLGQTLAAMRFEDEYVGKQRERRPVGDDAGKTDLRGAMVHTKAERIFDRAIDGGPWDAARPIAVFRQEFMNDCHIQTTRVG